MGLAPGTRIGAYELVASLGAGGMGEVYRARDTRLERTVALKVLPPEFADLDARARFEREARAIAAFNQLRLFAAQRQSHLRGKEDLGRGVPRGSRPRAIP